MGLLLLFNLVVSCPLALSELVYPSINVLESEDYGDSYDVDNTTITLQSFLFFTVRIYFA
jgi:hypothetical protein